MHLYNLPKTTLQLLKSELTPNLYRNQTIRLLRATLLKEVSNILNDNNPNNDESACGKLGAFINQINANERRDTLTADQADDLRTQAKDVMNQLDC
jgi:hypothetical protein